MVYNELYTIRKRRGIAVSELARRTGLSRMTITNIEKNRVVPNIETAFLISRELEVDINKIFFILDVNRDLQKKGVEK